VTDVSLIYITVGSPDEASRIGRDIVERRLVACVNIVERIGSLYWWEGKIAQENESLIIAKTKTSLVSRVIDAVKSLHSYSCPCIVALPITEGNEDFLSWVRRETL
jgi:periplasmic divalent cation tolerance protein